MKNKKYIPDFQVPEDYFRDFEDRLFVKIKEEKFPKSTGFTVPENYFEELEEQITNRTGSGSSSKVISIFTKYFAPVAAVAAILILVFNLNSNVVQEVNFENLNLSAIDQYIDEGNLNLKKFDMVRFLEDEEVSEMNLDTAILSQKDLEEYLADTAYPDFWPEE